MEKINITQHTNTMNNLKNCIISVLGGIGTSFWTWEKFYNYMFTIICGIIVTVCSAIIIHFIQKYWWKTKVKKQ